MSRKRNQESTLDIVLPITPMLDMSFQLLAFFIFTYHPSALEGQMELTLPASGEAMASTQLPDPSKQSDSALDLQSQVTVIVKTQHGDTAGDIGHIIVDGVMGKNPDPIRTTKELQDYLEKMLKDSSLSNKDDIKRGK